MSGPELKQMWKEVADIDVLNDEIPLSLNGAPITMKGNPGRPQKVVLAPLSPQIAEVASARESHIHSSQISNLTTRDPEGDGTFNAILSAMAAEADNVEFDRLEAQRHGHETSSLAIRRARILKSMADLILQKKKSADNTIIDLDSPNFEKVFEFTLQTFKEAMVSAGCRKEIVETVFTNLGRTLNNDWKEDAKNKMRGK